ncbi:TPA: gamma subclass chorismate mutase AroQ [Enterobacter ludwigii]|nr:gamma subclass chorismate mutase AroQ [Enterobacter ludwigii]
MEKKHELAAGPSIQGDGIAETTTATEVFSGPGMSINLRFCLMKEVAAYKAQQGQAIADPEQERDVLERAFAVAHASGLERESVRSFIQLQMDIAKAIQHFHCADWLMEEDTPRTPMPLSAVRAKIAHADESTLRSIARKLKTEGGFSGADKAAFMREIQHEKVRDRDKERLWATVKKILLHSFCGAS